MHQYSTLQSKLLCLYPTLSLHQLTLQSLQKNSSPSISIHLPMHQLLPPILYNLPIPSMIHISIPIQSIQSQQQVYHQCPNYHPQTTILLITSRVTPPSSQPSMIHFTPLHIILARYYLINMSSTIFSHQMLHPLYSYLYSHLILSPNSRQLHFNTHS